jgi:hypothetical protein
MVQNGLPHLTKVDKQSNQYQLLPQQDYLLQEEIGPEEEAKMKYYLVEGKLCQGPQL